MSEEIEFSPHAKKRIRTRGIDEGEVISALRNPDRVLLAFITSKLDIVDRRVSKRR